MLNSFVYVFFYISSSFFSLLILNNNQRFFPVTMDAQWQHNAERLLKLIEEIYRWLPLGTIVNNRVFVVHGGISDTTDLDLLKSLDRGKVSKYFLFSCIFFSVCFHNLFRNREEKKTFCCQIHARQQKSRWIKSIFFRLKSDFISRIDLLTCWFQINNFIIKHTKQYHITAVEFLVCLNFKMIRFFSSLHNINILNGTEREQHKNRDRSERERKI